MFAAALVLHRAIESCQQFARHHSSIACSICHIKCRNSLYPRTSIQRFPVPDEKVSWSVAFPEYAPVKYTADSVLKQPSWADTDFEVIQADRQIWNKVDPVNKIDRTSHHGTYSVVEGLPRNPVGRTGVCGRGLLGRWGPNHAADPIVTRWKRTDLGDQVLNVTSKKPVLQFVAIQRRDSGEWALPGGMVDPGEVITMTLKREFSEEAMNKLELPVEEQEINEHKIDDFFKKPKQVYCGYVDDPRNTDNAWMETVAFNFHDSTGEFVGKLQLHAGDDAVGVKWMDIDQSLQLYATHADFVRIVVERLGAHW
jgi:ADP-ribose pyrophosphatase